jgi:hypothetical protein
LGRIRTINLSSDFYHMNWGWGGTGMDGNTNNNGWFRFDNIQINGSTTKGESTNFRYNRKYLTGIRP